MDELISIIVPIYNAEKYLTECLQSIIAQTYRNIEILLIDDGSTDDSKIICNDFALRDNRIQYFYKENGGVSSARNYGINIAKGEYIFFADADDYLFTDTIEKLHKLIGQNDLVMCMMQKFDYKSEIKRVEHDAIYVCSINDAIRNILLAKKTSGYLFNKLFRTDVIKNNKNSFNLSIHNCEDELFILEYLNEKSKVVFNESIVYAYRNTPGSALNSGINEKSATAVFSRELIYKRVKELVDDEELISFEYNKLMRTLIYIYIGALRGKIDKHWKRRIREIEKKYRGEYKLTNLTLKKKIGYFILRMGF